MQKNKENQYINLTKQLKLKPQWQRFLGHWKGKVIQQKSKRTVCKVTVMAGFLTHTAVKWLHRQKLWGCKPGVVSDNTFTDCSKRHRNQSQVVSGHHWLHRHPTYTHTRTLHTHTLTLCMHRQAEAKACNSPPGDTGVSWFDFMRSCLLLQRL